MEHSLLVSRRETAQALGLSVRTLDALVARHEIRPRRIGRRVLFERSELERFVRRDHSTRAANAQSKEERQ